MIISANDSFNCNYIKVWDRLTIKCIWFQKKDVILRVIFDNVMITDCY